MRRLGRSAVVASVGVLVLSMVGCTPDEPGQGSSPSPAPSSPAASPTESDEDRAERERGEHAIEVYEKADDELGRLLQDGEGAPSDEFKQYAADSYLEAVTGLLAQMADDELRTQSTNQRLDIWVVGTAREDLVRLTICEDGSKNKTLDGDGEPLPANGEPEPYIIQTADVSPIANGTWKVKDVGSEFHTSFEGTECADAE